jgi:hypothetical protein
MALVLRGRSLYKTVFSFIANRLIRGMVIVVEDGWPVREKGWDDVHKAVPDAVDLCVSQALTTSDTDEDDGSPAARVGVGAICWCGRSPRSWEGGPALPARFLVPAEESVRSGDALHRLSLMSSRRSEVVET